MGCQCDKEQSVTQGEFNPQYQFTKNNKNQSQSNSIYIVPPSLTIDSSQVNQIKNCPQNLFLDVNLSEMFKQNFNSNLSRNHSQISGFSKSQMIGNQGSKRITFKSNIQQKR